VKFLVPDWPAPRNVRAVNTLRGGGCSQGAFESFNLATHVGDDAQRVLANRARLQKEAALPSEPIWLRQVHGTNVVDASMAEGGVEADGAFASRRNRVCAVLTADCLPIFVCNRRGTEVAILHGGWRGLSSGIVEAGLRNFRAPADELIVWLGPAIGARAYEVGDEVRCAFVGRDEAASAAFEPGRPGKWIMDIYRLARIRLSASGVTAIYGGEYCTATQSDLFFSYRRDGVTGRMASLVWLE
jgi:purine-nucleoside/S-methyl-5'-thioadenosine phosphorylase / adenosine deaminase